MAIENKSKAGLIQKNTKCFFVQDSSFSALLLDSLLIFYFSGSQVYPSSSSVVMETHNSVTSLYSRNRRNSAALGPCSAESSSILPPVVAQNQEAPKQETKTAADCLMWLLSQKGAECSSVLAPAATQSKEAGAVCLKQAELDSPPLYALGESVCHSRKSLLNSSLQQNLSVLLSLFCYTGPSSAATCSSFLLLMHMYDK